MVTTTSPFAEATTPANLFDGAGQFCGEPVTSGALSRSQVIDRIMTLNPTASAQFLEDFSEDALRTYLDHLVNAQIPRGRMARWVRRGDTPGILMAEPRD